MHNEITWLVQKEWISLDGDDGQEKTDSIAPEQIINQGFLTSFTSNGMNKILSS